MQKSIKAIEATGVQVVAVSYDSVDVLKTFSDKQAISYPLLSDPDSKAITAYSIRNKEMAGKKYGDIDLDGIPYPGTFLVGKDGVIRAKLFVDGYKERHTPEELIQATKALGGK